MTPEQLWALAFLVGVPLAAWGLTVLSVGFDWLVGVVVLDAPDSLEGQGR